MVEPQGPEISMRAIELTDKDIFDAMKSIPGYLDITPGDFREVYKHAFKFAVERIFLHPRFLHHVDKRNIRKAGNSPPRGRGTHGCAPHCGCSGNRR